MNIPWNFLVMIILQSQFPLHGSLSLWEDHFCNGYLPAFITIVTLRNSILRGSLPLVLVFRINLLSPLYLQLTIKGDP